MKTHILSLAIALSVVFALNAQDAFVHPALGDNCTSILVSPGASEDGSAITSHTCDSWYRTWMRWLPAVEYKSDTLVEVYTGLMHTEYPGSMDGVKVKGKVLQKAGKTYRVLDTAYPCLNEKQLAMGETTYGGRDTLRNKDGLLMIEELARLALQRCATAREAILYMGELAYEYGYGDGGECLTVIDPKEAWIFEIQGEGPDQLGAVWAACRIPDGEVSVSANISRIGSLKPLTEPATQKSKKGKKAPYKPLESETVMASQNVFSVARRLGLWDGKGEFSFWRAYSGENYEGETSIGCRIRGIKDGKEHTYYVYNNCKHQEAYKETGMQGVSYTTGVPAMIGAMMFVKGIWKKPGVWNVEDFDPDPFMEQLNKQGLPWHEVFDGDLEL